MLRPQVPDLVEQASTLGIKVTMTTNGTLIDKAKAKRLVEGGLRGVNISIDSPIRKMHEKIRGVEGSFKATMKAVQLFRRYKHKGKLTIRINTVVSRTNYQTLETLPDLAHELGADGINLIPVELPDVPYDAMRIILTAEAAAAFDELTRSDRDKELVQQGKFDWPNTFRTARFIPAADYINANRLRSIAIQKWDELMRTVDVIVTPTGAANLTQLVATNLTGHPAVILPNGFRDDGTPVSLTFLGGLFEEAKLLAIARAYQEATAFHLRHPVVTVST